jgi:hypothetical protein
MTSQELTPLRLAMLIAVAEGRVCPGLGENAGVTSFAVTPPSSGHGYKERAVRWLILNRYCRLPDERAGLPPHWDEPLTLTPKGHAALPWHILDEPSKVD